MYRPRLVPVASGVDYVQPRGERRQSVVAGAVRGSPSFRARVRVFPRDLGAPKPDSAAKIGDAARHHALRALRHGVRGEQNQGP